jgi:hypothetical protein
MTQPPDWDRIYANAVNRAENGNEGLVTFAPLSSNPVQSMLLTTQDIRDDDSGLRNYHVHIVSQPPNFPETPRNMNLMQREGYRRYLRRVLVTHRSTSAHVIATSFDEWREMFMSVISVMDESIRDRHGVLCFEDGNMNNNDVTNVFYMHICDVMNVYICRLAGEVPVVYLPTPSFNTVNVKSKNMLTDRMLSTEQINFFIQEIDFLYNSYAYFANYSFLPVRTLLEPRDDVITTAHFYTHDDHFRTHQDGKLKVIERDQNRHLATVVYRSI